jgi:hypothetical protein
MSTSPKITPTPLGRQERRGTIRPNGSAGPAQVWEAESADGRWLYVRTERRGTPWLVLELDPETGKPTELSELAAVYVPSLPKARVWTACGLVESLIADTAKQQAARAERLAAVCT